MVKTFVDYYLIDDLETVAQCARYDKLASLNAMEQSLLVDALTRLDKLDEAKAIADKLQMEASTDKYDSYENSRVDQYNKIFDMVLNLNSLDADKSKPLEMQLSKQNSTAGKGQDKIKIGLMS
jgi:hypothetical protein